MALRSLDNTLPTTPERPKKIAKIVGPTARTPPLVSVSGVNDENSAPTAGAEIVDPTPDYIASKDLNALPDPESILNVTSSCALFDDLSWFYFNFF